MTQPQSACLVFKTASNLIACGGDAEIGIEVVGEGAGLVDVELIRQAAAGVLHYFKVELGRRSVTVGEFAQALARVLRGFGLEINTDTSSVAAVVPTETDLTRLANESGGTFELGFFPRLRHELAQQLMPRPRLVRFIGLRSCVKRLTGARRWSGRCQTLNDQIVEYVRQCLVEHRDAGDCAVVVL